MPDYQQHERFGVHYLRPTSLHAKVRNRLAELVPPTNVAEAKAVASAGELAIPYLTYIRRRKSTDAAACVRALALIASDGSFSALAEYTPEQRQTVLKEIFKARDSFDSVEYDEQVLARLSPPYLNLNRVASFVPFQGYSTLSSLEVANCSQVNDFDPLSSLSMLRRLNLRLCIRVHDLAPLGALCRLESLDLAHCFEVHSLEPLATLVNLRTLALTAFREAIELSPISGMPSLERLLLWGLPLASDLRPLSMLPSLRSLTLGSLEHLQYLTDFAYLPQISSLTLGYLKNVADLTPLQNLTALSSLTIVTAPQQEFDLSPLIDIGTLKFLTLAGLGGHVEVPDELSERVVIHHWP